MLISLILPLLQIDKIDGPGYPPVGYPLLTYYQTEKSLLLASPEITLRVNKLTLKLAQASDGKHFYYSISFPQLQVLPRVTTFYSFYGNSTIGIKEPWDN